MLGGLCCIWGTFSLHRTKLLAYMVDILAGLLMSLGRSQALGRRSFHRLCSQPPSSLAEEDCGSQRIPHSSVAWPDSVYSPEAWSRWWALNVCMRPAAVLLSWATFTIASWYANSTSSWVTTSLILFHFSGISSHWCTEIATCVPRGFANTGMSPGTALLSGMINSLGCKQLWQLLPEQSRGLIPFGHPIQRFPLPLLHL